MNNLLSMNASVSRGGSGKRSARRRNGAETREKIVTAALHAFADLGFDGATTRDIAACAGVNQGLITYHFSSKEELWKAAADHIFALLRDSFASRMQALQDADALTRIRLLARHYVRFAAAHPEMHRLMLQEGKNDGPRLHWLVDRHVRPLYDVSCALIREAQAEGILGGAPPAHLHYLLVGATSLLFVMAPEFRRLTGHDPMRKESIEAHADAIVGLVMSGALQSAPAPRTPRRGAKSATRAAPPRRRKR
jgi:AcrR family transcriptional regulator